MNHPHHLLADLVDGTLDAAARAQVEAHLAACDSCRDDVDAARTGRRAARSLPEVAAPVDLHDRIVARGGGREGPPRWYRWAGAAAAAALVVAVALALPNVGGGEADRATAPEDAAGAPAESQGLLSGDSVVLEVQEADYDAAALERLAADAGSGAPAAQAADATTREAPEAIRCVARAFEEQPAGRLTRLIQARFEGRPAYIAVYLEGPGADQPHDTAAAWVAARGDCTILSFAQARI
jgi:hypothetical protein